MPDFNFHQIASALDHAFGHDITPSEVEGAITRLVIWLEHEIGAGDPPALCFYAGTAIRTPAGEVAVETLKAGDMVLTTDGETRPIAWLGRQTVVTRVADPLRSAPIRIKSGALGDAMPVRDLVVSPDHALLIDGVLIQAGALVNNVSILRETGLPETFVYYHVELADHSLILAENVPAETFIDNADRLAFDNWQEHVALHPEGAVLTEMSLPRAKSARQVPYATRGRIGARAEAMLGAIAIAA